MPEQCGMLAGVWGRSSGLAAMAIHRNDIPAAPNVAEAPC
jgi:hypothetical protein